MHWNRLERKDQNKNLPTSLLAKGKHSFDINLEVAIQPENAKPTVVSHSNFKYYIGLCAKLYTTSNGCRVNSEI
jgi:fumarylacetoacetase